MKYVALTFSDEKYIKARQRYVSEMAEKAIFSKIYSLGPEDIYDEFLKDHESFINNNPRGYGYWIWKPFIVHKILMELDDGDILVYGDAGNELSGSREECLQIFDIVKNLPGTKLIAQDSYRTYLFTKTDLFFKVRWYGLLYVLKLQVQAGRLVIEKNDKTQKFVSEWLKICTINYKNIDDSPSLLPKLPRFVEHRHDQSVFSLLFHAYNCKSINFGNIWKASRLKF
ncbi:MAG TPA: hypothetical protein VIJ75_02655 [Hanamia sp.]